MRSVITAPQDKLNVIDNNENETSKTTDGVCMDLISNTYKINFHGILFPMQRGGADDLNPNIVVNIIPELN